MGRSNALRLADVRAVFRLVGDCRDVGRDLSAWNRRTADGLQQLTGSVLVVSIVQPGGVGPLVEGVTAWHTPWACDSDRRTWVAITRDGPRLFGYPSVRAVYASRDRLRTQARRRILSDQEWERSAERDDRRQLGQDDLMLSAHWTPAGNLHSLSLNRAAGDRRFSGREVRMVRLFHDETARLFGTSLTAADPLADLPPRLRRVLDGLAAGDSEKQLAARLGVTRATAHGYVTELYRRAGVHSRGELLAWFHGR